MRNVLYRPFDIETHKREFTNYLEVIIDEGGTVMYAVPSHQQKLIMLACEKLQISRDELSDMCPEAYYCDFNNWLCKVSGCVAMYNEFMDGVPSAKQVEVIQKLKDEGLYRGDINSSVSNNSKN